MTVLSMGSSCSSLLACAPPRMGKREEGRSGCGGPKVQPDVVPLLRFRLLERLSAAVVENGLGAVVENHLVLV
jgi:hypothetical protein